MQPAVVPRVSIVVASHRSVYIKDLADAFAGQEYFGDFAVEVIIVADYPVEEYQRRYPAVRWIFLEDAGISVKRNAGSKVARGEVLAFIDDDCVPAAGWAGQGLFYLDNNKDAAGCEGRTILECEAVAAPAAEFKRLEKAGFRTNNIFYKKSVFESAGGFDERFTFQREDADLAFSVLSLGHTIGYCPEAMVTHRVRRNENWDLLKNCVNRRFDPLLYKKHPALYRKHIGSPIPPGIGCIMAFHVLFLFALVVSIALWPVAAAVDCLTALALSVRRNRNGKNGLLWVVRDFISFSIAPFVILGVLLYGSVKYRKFLMF
jgi:GT2 family glycosyltransferase